MDTVVVFTQEIDDLELATKELVGQVRDKLTLKKHSIGIVHCDSDVDTAGLGKLLYAELGINVVGITTTAMIDRHNGYNDLGITLSVLTADDVNFTIGVTGELNSGSYRDTIRHAYQDAVAKLDGDLKLIMMLAPFANDITSENYVEVIDEMAGGVPIFGGVATDHYDLQYQKTFFNGEEFTRGLVFIMFTGNLKPVFAMEHHFGAKVKKKGIITKSSKNLIHEVDGQSFKEFISSMIPVPDEEVVVFHFQSTPFIMELPDYEEDEQPVVRALLSVDHKTGSGGFLSKMPESSSIYMNILQRDNLGESCKGSMEKVLSQMADNKDYQYSMMFISTCNARHLLMGDAKNLESNIVTDTLKDQPLSLNAMGFYGFGEVCPTGKRANDTFKNRYHNVSFAVCAI